MDLSRFDSEAHRNLLRDELHAKYAAKKIDVVVAVMEPALNFLLNHRDEVFPGIPIVFCGFDGKLLGDRSLPEDMTGVFETGILADSRNRRAHASGYRAVRGGGWHVGV